MTDATWSYPTSIRSGTGRVAGTAEVGREAGITNPLIVTDPGLVELAPIAAVRNALAAADVPSAVFSDLRPNPVGRDVDAGVAAISDSTRIDAGAESTLFPPWFDTEIAAAVGGDVQVVMDGGIRRGADVVKALCLGADAVLIGRAYLWGLAVNGTAGVENVLDVIRGGIDATMRGIGVGSITDLGPEYVIVPDGFSPPRIS